MDDLASTADLAAGPRTPHTWWLAVAIVFLGVALRAWNLDGTGYTSDEIEELKLSRAPLADLILDRDGDRFPPLHRSLVGIEIRSTGSDLAARWLSVVCGGLTLVVVWRSGVMLLGDWDALWPTLLITCSPFHIFYCRDGRAYSMYMLWAAVMFWAALRLLRRGAWRDWLMLIVATAGAVYTHYYAAPLAVVVWAITLYVTIRRDGWRWPLTAALGASVLLAPAPILLWMAMSDLPNEKLVAWFDVEALGFAYVSLATGFAAGPSIQELRSMPASEGIRQFLPWVAAIGFAYATLGWYALRRLRKFELALLLAPPLVLVPILGIVGNLIEQGFVFRYVSWMTIPYALLLGAGARRWRQRPIVAVAIAALLMVNGVAIFNRNFDPRYAEEDFRAVAKKLDELDPERGPVLVASDYTGTALSYYAGTSRSIASFPIFSQHVAEREAAIDEFLVRHPPGTRFTLVSQWLPADDVRRATRDAALHQFAARLVAELNQTEIYSAAVP